MSEQLPERIDMRQLRTQAKELLRELQRGENAANVKLADAQFSLAKRYGFESWPKLVKAVEGPLLDGKLRTAVFEGDTAKLEKLLRTNPSLRARLNEPLFEFDMKPILKAAQHPNGSALIPILVRYGANPNIRSKWWAGGFSALDLARGDSAEALLKYGAVMDVHSAAKLGALDVLKHLLDEEPSRVNAIGGDGQTPLHVAATAEIAELLITRGANLEQRDVDHESTPIQYQVRNLEIVRALLRHGATPDIYTAVVLDDVDLLQRILRQDPETMEAHIGAEPFVTVKSNGGHIYAYLLGSGKAPFQVAAELGSRTVFDELRKLSPPSSQLVAAAWVGDAGAVEALLRDHPGLGGRMGADARAITDAAQAGKTETVRLLLQAGLDPTTPGMDSGSALHVACWFGYLETVRLLMEHVPLELRDANHGSTPLGWATHGAQWGRNPAGDYPAVVEALLTAGADPFAPANSEGTSLLVQAGSRQEVKDILIRFGAK